MGILYAIVILILNSVNDYFWQLIEASSHEFESSLHVAIHVVTVIATVILIVIVIVIVIVMG